MSMKILKLTSLFLAAVIFVSSFANKLVYAKQDAEYGITAVESAEASNKITDTTRSTEDAGAQATTVVAVKETSGGNESGSDTTEPEIKPSEPESKPGETEGEPGEQENKPGGSEGKPDETEGRPGEEKPPADGSGTTPPQSGADGSNQGEAENGSNQSDSSSEQKDPANAPGKTENPNESLNEKVLVAKVFENGSYENPISDSEGFIKVKGYFPANAYVMAYPVELDLNLFPELSLHENEVVLWAYDITIFDESGAVWQPKPENPVKVSFSSKDLAEYEQVNVYHVAEGVTETEKNPEENSSSGDTSSPNSSSEDTSLSDKSSEELESGREVQEDASTESPTMTPPADSIEEESGDKAFLEFIGEARVLDNSVEFNAISFSTYVIAVTENANLTIEYRFNNVSSDAGDNVLQNSNKTITIPPNGVSNMYIAKDTRGDIVKIIFPNASTYKVERIDELGNLIGTQPEQNGAEWTISDIADEQTVRITNSSTANSKVYFINIIYKADWVVIGDSDRLDDSIAFDVNCVDTVYRSRMRLNPTYDSGYVPVTEGSSVFFDFEHVAAKTGGELSYSMTGSMTGSGEMPDNTLLLENVTPGASITFTVTTGTVRREYAIEMRALRALSTVETISNAKHGIQMWMTDLTTYNEVFPNRPFAKNYPLRRASGSDQFTFMGRGYNQGLLEQGLVKDKLPIVRESNIYNQSQLYFPALKDNSYGAGFSLQRLFGEVPVDNLFIKKTYDDTGYFYFSSAENFAALESNRSFTVYNALGVPRLGTAGEYNNFVFQRGHFMPYNRLDTTLVASNNLYDIFGAKLEATDPRYNEPIYSWGSSANNYHFGMNINANFIMPEGGMMDNGDPMIFEFTGDDDLWVFIDNILVLDLGGIHDAQSGYINFATGKIGFTNTSNSDSLNQTSSIPWKDGGTIFQKFKDAWVSTSSFNTAATGNPNTFADHTGHNIRVFYLEHGGGGSNLRIKFNLPTLPKGDLQIAKEVVGISSASLKVTDFKMRLYLQDLNNKSRFIPYDGDYTINGSNILHTNNGEFTIKDNESAIFSNLQEGQLYYIEEYGLSKDIYGADFELVTNPEQAANPQLQVATPTVEADGTVTYRSKTYTYEYAKAETVVLKAINRTKTPIDSVPVTLTKTFFGTAANKAPAGFMANFFIYSNSNGNTSYERIPYAQIADTGSHTFNLAPGSYWIEEVIVNAGNTPSAAYINTAITGFGQGAGQNALKSAVFEIKQSDIGTQELREIALKNIYGSPPAELNIFKEDGEQNPLAGAVFRLYKDGDPTALGEFTTDALGKAVVKIYDAANYRLEETPPTGYQGVAPIYFSYDTAQAVKFYANSSYAPASELAELNGIVSIVPGKVEYSSANMTLKVINLPIYNLPLTGGKGSAVFKIVGGAVLTGAATARIAVRRRRKH